MLNSEFTSGMCNHWNEVKFLRMRSQTAAHNTLFWQLGQTDLA
jgi:hypothetical protein